MSNYSAYQSLVEYPFPLTNPSYQVYQSVVETARPATQFLLVSGALGDNRIDGHVISLKRFSNLCNPPQRGTLILDTSFPRANINTAERLVLFESGYRVLTGYVTKVTRERPSYHWIIDFEDEYTRVVNTFLSDEMVFETASSMKYIIQQILEPTGIRYRVGGPDWAVAPGARIGLRSAHDALTEVMAYGGLYAWCDPDGLLRLRKSPGRKFQQNVREPIGIQHSISTEQTRNDVHVYGGILENGVLVNVASHKDVEGLVVDLKTVVANPLLTTYSDAQRISDYLLNELGSLTDILTFEITGNPFYRIGTSGSFYHQDSANLVTSGSGPITSMETTVDEKGYVMNITINERCPRIAGWTQPPNQMRALWIACRGGGADPRPEKLIWTGDFGLGGMPTYNIVKTIPSGKIIGMQVTRSGSRVYLLMQRQTDTDPVDELWYTDDPFVESVEWTLLGVPTISSIGASQDVERFGVSSIPSMQMVGNTLYLSIRYIYFEGLGFKWRHTYSLVREGETSITTIGRGGYPFGGEVLFPSVINTRNYTSQGYLGTIYFRTAPPFGINAFLTPADASFNPSLYNGVSLIAPNRDTGSWWTPDVQQDHLLYAGYFGGAIFDKGSSIYTHPGKIPSSSTRIRGDYFASQYQFVDNEGWLYMGQLGGAPSAIFQWSTFPGSAHENCGIVLCIDKIDPKRLAWIPDYNVNSNETARYSADGGVTWQNMTGNWWGSNGEVVNGSRMQSDGDFLVIDAHPTFWSTEIVPDDGA